MEIIHSALVLGLVLIAGTAIEQAPSVGPLRKFFFIIIEAVLFDVNCLNFLKVHLLLCT